MKRALLLLGMGLTLLACSRMEIAQEPEQSICEEMCFTAYVKDIETKTERQSDGSVFWNPGDAVSLFFNQGDHGGNRFVAQNTEVSAIAEFRGTITGFAGGGESTGGEFWFWGVYPYSENNSCDGTSVTLTLPAQQTAKAGSFANGLFPTMARSQGLSLGFYNICGGFKFTVSRDDIKAVKFRGNANEDIAGKAKVIWDSNGHPAVSEHLVGYKEVTVTAPNNGTFVPGIEYYIVFYPELLSEGFTLTFITSASKQGSFSYTQSRQLKRGVFINGSNLDTHVTAWSDVESPIVPDPPVNTDEGGLYLGITGFNSSLNSFPIAKLNSTTKPSFDSFIDGLTMKNGTLLYYSVNDAIDKLQSAACPADLYNVALVSFTDGLDRGTPMMVEDYPGNDAYLSSIHNRIVNETVSGQPMTAWSVGIKGNDVENESLFNTNLQSIATSSDYSFRVSNMTEVNDRFQSIAEHLNETNYVQKISVEIPGEENGTRIRFTLDGAASATVSSKYIEGVFNLSSRSLTNITYQGLSSSSGSSVTGVVDGIMVTFTFDGISNEDGILVEKHNIREWLYQQNQWVKNSEFEPDNNTNIVVEKRSAIVFLNLDCSTSLGDDFYYLKTSAKSFIAKLCEATTSDDNSVVTVSLNKTALSLRPGRTAQLQVTTVPTEELSNGVLWSSSNQSVATVSNAGIITAISNGEAIITVSLSSNPSITASCHVTVSDTQFSSNPMDLSLAVSLPDGNRFYVSQSQFSNADLSDYVIEGICVFASYGNFLLSMHNASSDAMVYSAAELGFSIPTKNQGQTISARWTDINHALQVFGGEQLSSSAEYWTSGSWSSGHYTIKGSGGSLVGQYDYCLYCVREAIPISSAVAPYSFILPSRGFYLSVTNGSDRIVLNSSSSIPSGYYTEGLAIDTKGIRFVIALSDASSDSMTYTSAASTFSTQIPSTNQGKLISARFTDINDALVRFGGEPMSVNKEYWTSATWSSGHCYFKGGGGKLIGEYDYMKYYLRLVLGEWD